MVELYDLRIEHLPQPNAVDNTNPRFSWKIRSDSKGIIQKSRHIEAFCGEKLIWDSGNVCDRESRFVCYEGQQLLSRQKVHWRVQVTCEDEKGEQFTSPWAESDFQMGLLKENDWSGKWITVAKDAPGRRKAAYLRRKICVKDGLLEARLYQTAHGVYESSINGSMTDHDLFKPGLTSYYYRIQYQSYDVTPLLHEGENIWSVIIADGWWRGSTGGSVINNFGRTLDYLGQLELFYEDGRHVIIGSDEQFEISDGPLLASDMLMGDIYDARVQTDQWHPATFSTREDVTSGFDAKKVATRSVPVRRMEQFEARPFRDASGSLVLDFGQNIAGNVRMVLRHTKPGQKVRLIHGETLDHNGIFTVDNVSHCSLPVDAFQEVIYYCKGAEEEIYQPAFSIFGFRYVLMEGYEEKIQKGDFIASAIYSDMGVTADFDCSNLLINQLVHNSIWSMKGNFMDVPTDCPTRERNAWTGDAQVFVRTACTFADSHSFYEKWLQDQTFEQYASGKVGITFPSTSSVHNPKELSKEMLRENPLYALAGPTGNGNIGEDAVGWGDSAVWLPYSVYLYSGDKQILLNQFETARKWLEFELNCAKDENPLYKNRQYYKDGVGQYVLDTRFQYGEWLEAIGVKEKVERYYTELNQNLVPIKIGKPEPSSEESKKAVQQYLLMMAKKGNAETATAYMARSADVVAKMAEILGKSEDAKKYNALANKISEIYAKYLIGEDGCIENGHQAPYVRALTMELCGDKEEMVFAQLLKEVKDNDYALNTGFLSTPFLLPVLADRGQTEVAYRILENEELPGWLYPVKKGMTTIPESWSAADILTDSQNHYSYGAVCEFLFQYVAGIRIDSAYPGWEHFVLKPVPGGSLKHAQATQNTPYGKISTAWQQKEKQFYFTCTIPANTTADLILPDGTSRELGSGEYEFCCNMD